MNSYTAARTETVLSQGMLVIGSATLIALSGQVSIPLPFTPIPLALQVHTALLMGALLGSRLGFLSVALFLLMGAIGLPVFSLGGAGLSILLGPRGGYLIGYLLGAWATGVIIERKNLTSPALKAMAMGLGNLVVYACGLPQLALFVGAERVFLLGMLPFLAGDLIKLFASYRFIKAISR
jgi:biotin transport system substrate-specific component